MPKNIVVYSDGTGQDGGVRPEQRISNVYKMYRASRVHPDNAIDPAEQVCFYDPGLGTDSDVDGLLGIIRTGQKFLQSVTGRGITKNMADCYEFIINHYEEGDRIVLIGFSRGAYTVRCLANALMLCGIPTKTAEGPFMRYRKSVRDIAKEAVETVYEHGAGHARAEYETERDEQARRFRRKYGSDSTKPDAERDQSNVAAYFIGVFDTVAALGASGKRRLLIQFGLTLAFTVGFALVFSVLAIVPSLILKFIGAFGFWWSELSLTTALVAVANAWFWIRQRQQYKKTIYDFPNKGDPPRSHFAEWKSENFDRLLSKYVETARSANALDETRKDFDRVAWGSAANAEHLSQMWFAGNHSDIGGSYPETESRLSDISLKWMIEETLKLSHPLKLGPVTVNGTPLPGTGSQGTPLHLYPAANGPQHCEITGMRDFLDATAENWPRLLRGLVSSENYETITRVVLHDANVDETVTERFGMTEVIDCAKTGAYRPEALRNHDKFKHLYPPLPVAAAVAPPGRSEEPTLPMQMPP
jgi:uncharacterized protein (DUF2235 family)